MFVSSGNVNLRFSRSWPKCLINLITWLARYCNGLFEEVVGAWKATGVFTGAQGFPMMGISGNTLWGWFISWKIAIQLDDHDNVGPN